MAGYRFNEIHDLQMAISFLAESICADEVAVCALFVYTWFRDRGVMECSR